MRWIFLGLASVVFCITGHAHGQTQPSEQEIAKLLEKQEIFVGPSLNGGTGRAVRGRLQTEDAVKALDLLRAIKDLNEIQLELDEPKFAKDILDRIKGLAKVTRLELIVHRLSDDDLKTVINLNRLESLSLECPQLTDAQVRQLSAMKGIKHLDLHSAEVTAKYNLDNGAITAKAVEELKRTLPAAKIEFYPLAKLVYLPHLAIDAKDGALAKLKKERFNASLDAVKLFDRAIKAGRYTSADLEFIGLARFLRDAALDLDDPAFAMRFIDDYVRMTELSVLECRLQWEAGKLEPHKYHQARYHYLDAQILQARLKEQLDKK